MLKWLQATLVSLLLILGLYYMIPTPRNRFIVDHAPWALPIVVPWLAWEWIKIGRDKPEE